LKRATNSFFDSAPSMGTVTLFVQRGLLSLWLAILLSAWLSEAIAAPEVPEPRIVSLAPHLTELAFDVGAGERIVATVEYSDYPQAARAIPRIGDAFLVDLERLIAIRPQLVLAWDTGTPVPTIERIRALGLRVEVFSTQRLQDVAAAIRRLGELAGTEAVANATALKFEDDMRALRVRYQDRAPIRVFLQINDRPLYTVNDQQIISEIAELCGGKNVFAHLNELAPTIGEEAVIAANPQAIVSTDDTVPDPRARWERWQHLAAVRAGNVFSLRSDDLARPTTRLAKGASAMCQVLDTARENLRRAKRTPESKPAL
jgi:iron complex transport system substrate-binding protein